MRSFIHAIKYHNITPIAIAFVLLGATGAVASDDIRHAVIGERIEEIQGVDNKALLSLDVDALDQEIRITDVSETDAAYRVSYAFETFDVREHDWGPVTKEGVLTIEKDALGGADLGLYVQDELSEIVDAHADYLATAKERAEASGRTTPTQTTSYTKLAGLVLNSQTKELDGYEPEVEPPEARRQETEDTTNYSEPTRIAESDEQKEEPQDEQENTTDNNESEETTDKKHDTAEAQNETGDAEDTTPPTITINGNNPAQVDVSTTYNDLGATVTDNVDDNLGIKASVNGTDVGDLSNISIDTSTTSEHTIEYRATDNAGNTGTAVRTVVVGSGADNNQDTAETQNNEGDAEEEDTTAPEITLEGSASIELTVGDTYAEPGYSASDDTDGDITSDVVVAGDTVDTTTAGAYTVTYNVEDAAGNAADEKVRTVTVVEPEPTPEEETNTDTASSTPETQ